MLQKKIDKKIAFAILGTFLLLCVFGVFLYSKDKSSSPISSKNYNYQESSTNYPGSVIVKFKTEPTQADIDSVMDRLGSRDYEMKNLGEEGLYSFKKKLDLYTAEYLENYKKSIPDSKVAVQSAANVATQEEIDAMIINNREEMALKDVNREIMESFERTIGSMVIASSLNNVEYIEPDYYGRLLNFAYEDDPGFEKQWGLYNDGEFAKQEDLDIDGPEGWKMHSKKTEVIIAVMDEGVAYDHPDLGGCMGPGCKFVNGYDFFDDDADPWGDYEHATHISGIIAADDNDIGIIGICPECKILPIKVFERRESYISSFIAGFNYVANRDDVDILNASFEIVTPDGDLDVDGDIDADDLMYSKALRSSIQKALDSGIIIVAAAGNSSDEGPIYPASHPGVIAVGAHDSTGSMSYFSNWGEGIDFVAPGSSIYSTVRGGGHETYKFQSGTSMASPHVAGIIGMMMQNVPDKSYTREQIYDALLRGADDFTDLNRSRNRGDYKAANLAGALREFKGLCDANVVDSNNSRVIDIFDLSYVGQRYDRQVTPGTEGDINYDGVVDIFDMTFFGNNYGKQVPDYCYPSA